MRTRIGITISALATGAAIMLLYTNLPVVAAQRGVVPAAVAALVPVFLAIAVVHQTVVRGEGLVMDRTLWGLWALLALQLLATFSAEGYDVALARIGVFLSEGILVYFLIRNSVRTLAGLRRAVLAVTAAATLLASLTLVQAVTGSYEQDFLGLAQRSLEHLDGMPAAYREEVGLEDRARGPVDDPNRFAQILLMALPLAFVLGLNAHRRGAALLAAGCVGLMLGAVLLTYSRGAFVTMIVMLGLTARLGLIRPRRLLAVAAVLALLTPVVIPGYVERIVSIGGVADLFGSSEVVADGPTRGRTTEMLAALAAYNDHPVLGVGPGQYMPYHSVHYQALPEISIRDLAIPRRAHSLYLELAAESGTLGLVLFLSLFALLLRDLGTVRAALQRRRPDLARLAAAFSLALLSYLGTGVFLHLAFERYLWLMVGLTAAASAILHEHASAGSLPPPDAGPVVPTTAGDTRVERVAPWESPPSRRVASP